MKKIFIFIFLSVFTNIHLLAQDYIKLNKVNNFHPRWNLSYNLHGLIDYQGNVSPHYSRGRDVIRYSRIVSGNIRSLFIRTEAPQEILSQENNQISYTKVNNSGSVESVTKCINNFGWDCVTANASICESISGPPDELERCLSESSRFVTTPSSCSRIFISYRAGLRRHQQNNLRSMRRLRNQSLRNGRQNRDTENLYTDMTELESANRLFLESVVTLCHENFFSPSYPSSEESPLSSSADININDDDRSDYNYNSYQLQRRIELLRQEQNSSRGTTRQ